MNVKVLFFFFFHQDLLSWSFLHCFPLSLFAARTAVLCAAWFIMCACLSGEHQPNWGLGCACLCPSQLTAVLQVLPHSSCAWGLKPKHTVDKDAKVGPWQEKISTHGLKIEGRALCNTGGRGGKKGLWELLANKRQCNVLHELPVSHVWRLFLRRAGSFPVVQSRLC